MTFVLIANCGIYEEGAKKAVKQWTGEIRYDPDKDHSVEALRTKLKKSLNLDKKCDEVGVKKYAIDIKTRTFVPSRLHKDGREFSVDSDENWAIAIPHLIKGDRELSGKTFSLDFPL